MTTELSPEWSADASTVYQPEQTWERLADVWLSPALAFKRLARTIDTVPSSSPLPLEAVSIVAIISALGALSRFALEGGDAAAFVFQAIAAAIGGLVSWNLSSLFFGMVGYAVSGKAPWKRIYILSAFSLLPWVFLAPITVIRTSIGSAGSVVGGLLSIAIWVWSTLLFSFALKEALQIRSTQLVVLLLLPLCLSMLWAAWFFGFIVNLIQFFAT